MERFRGGLVFKAQILLYHSTLGSRVTNDKKKKVEGRRFSVRGLEFLRFRVHGFMDLRFRVEGFE